jgi:hypothetical protein
MYTYPSGLRCRASKLRVTLYEWIVPPLAFCATFAGIPVLVNLYRGTADPLHVLALFLLSWIAWMIGCAALAYGLFVVWCRPDREDGDRKRMASESEGDCIAG